MVAVISACLLQISHPTPSPEEKGSSRFFNPDKRSISWLNCAPMMTSLAVAWPAWLRHLQGGEQRESHSRLPEVVITHFCCISPLLLTPLPFVTSSRISGGCYPLGAALSPSFPSFPMTSLQGGQLTAQQLSQPAPPPFQKQLDQSTCFPILIDKMNLVSKTMYCSFANELYWPLLTLWST